MRLQVGVRYFRPIVPRLTGFARLLAGVDLFGWDQRGRVGTLAYQDADDHIGLAVEAGAGVMYELGKVAFGAQLAVPVGVHREEKFDGTLEINQTAFDLELRFTIGTRY